MVDLNLGEYQAFCAFLQRECGIVLGDSKQYLVRSRLLPVARQQGYKSLSELLMKVQNGADATLKGMVINAMTTNETFWFRDVYPFELLKQHILPQLTAQKSTLKIWCAACSSGQEPYSVAMSLLEYQQATNKTITAGQPILATDISSEVLQQAKKAEYDALSMGRGLSPQRQHAFFEPVAGSGSFQLNQEVKKLVAFQPINLLTDFSRIGRFDLVFCRNVLIYFDQAVKKRILQHIAACLPTGGYLFVGASESISGLTDVFQLVRTDQGIVYQKK